MAQLINIVKTTIQTLEEQLLKVKKSSSNEEYHVDDVETYVKNICDDLSKYKVISNEEVKKLVSILSNYLNEDNIKELKSDLLNYRYNEAKSRLEKIKFDRDTNV